MLKNSIIKIASTELLGVYRDCCDAHDLCYGTYGKTQAACDAAFLSCNTGKCDAAYSGIWKFGAKQVCYAVKDSMQVRPAVPGAANAYAPHKAAGRQTAIPTAGDELLVQALVTGSLGVSAFASDQQLNCCPAAVG